MMTLRMVQWASLPSAPLLLLVALLAAFASSSSSSSARTTQAATVVLCKPSASVSRWLELPSVSGPAVPLRLASHPTQCTIAGSGSLRLGACGGAPAFRLVPSKRYPMRGYNLVEFNETSGVATGSCVDAKGLVAAQLYKCLDSANQGWNVNVSTGAIRETFDRRGSVLGLSTDPACVAAKPAPGPAPTPKPAGESFFAPRFHPIGGPKVYDPSGPLLDDSGRWHLWEDQGGWSSWTSRDLMHWDGTLRSSTHFGGLTGSVSYTRSGIFAFWPRIRRL